MTLPNFEGWGEGTHNSKRQRIPTIMNRGSLFANHYTPTARLTPCPESHCIPLEDTNRESALIRIETRCGAFYPTFFTSNLFLSRTAGAVSTSIPSAIVYKA